MPWYGCSRSRCLALAFFVCLLWRHFLSNSNFDNYRVFTRLYTRLVRKAHNSSLGLLKMLSPTANKESAYKMPNVQRTNTVHERTKASTVVHILNRILRTRFCARWHKNHPHIDSTSQRPCPCSMCPEPRMHRVIYGSRVFPTHTGHSNSNFQ